MIISTVAQECERKFSTCCISFSFDKSSESVIDQESFVKNNTFYISTGAGAAELLSYECKIPEGDYDTFGISSVVCSGPSFVSRTSIEYDLI